MTWDIIALHALLYAVFEVFMLQNNDRLYTYILVHKYLSLNSLEMWILMYA
jgi:hypothetical protein